MLAREIAGRRYALAIMDIAREDSSYEAWSSAIDVLEAMTNESHYCLLYTSPSPRDSTR